MSKKWFLKERNKDQALMITNKGLKYLQHLPLK